MDSINVSHVFNNEWESPVMLKKCLVMNSKEEIIAFVKPEDVFHFRTLAGLLDSPPNHFSNEYLGTLMDAIRMLYTTVE